jgi:hypothetical protein
MMRDRIGRKVLKVPELLSWPSSGVAVCLSSENTCDRSIPVIGKFGSCQEPVTSCSSQICADLTCISVVACHASSQCILDAKRMV